MGIQAAGYRIHDFALLAGVTVRALHHYDRLGLLKPRRSGAGFRIYVEDDLVRLEQIVALKFLGMPLKQIKMLLDRDPLQLSAALRLQRSVLEEKRRKLDVAITAIGNAEQILESGQPVASAVLKEIIEAIQMQTEPKYASEFMRNYYREDSWTCFRREHEDWPSGAWNDLFRDVQASLAKDPASAAAQALARRWRELRVGDSRGDPKLHDGLLKAWNDRKFWPEAVQNLFLPFDFERISAFICAAFSAYRQKNYGDIVWVAELEPFPVEERERFALAGVDLYFKIADALGEDPRGRHGQELAARWMEVLECRTGGHPGFSATPEWYESYLRWMNGWPESVHRKLRALDYEKTGAFILKAMACPVIF